MYYVLIEGPSYRDLDFEAREQIRQKLREDLEAHGIRFVQYDWVWDEEDHCLLLVGQYERTEDGRYWIGALESLGFTVLIRDHLPGEETERTTKTGNEITLRPVRREDKELLRSFAQSLSEEDLYFRFFRHVEPTEDLLTKLVELDPAEQTAILALVGRGKAEQIAGVGRFFIDRERATAEVVITIAADYRQKGIGREIFLHLISLARSRRLKGLTAQVLADNTAMMRLLRSLEGIEYTIKRKMEAGVFYLDMPFIDERGMEEHEEAS
ncbi:MAG: N-acetyltransferase family protein [Deltaproteobacteria bacterium]